MMKDKTTMYEFYPSQMDICFSERCNMNCDYCFVDKSNPAKLSFGEIKKAIDLFFALPVKHHTITLTTTESLIYPELFKKTLRYIFSSADCKNRKVSVIATTNGILLDDSMRKFLESLDSRFQLNISWDGKPESHNSHRKLKGSKTKSFNLSFKNYMAIKDKSKPRVILTVSPKEVSKLVENVNFIVGKGFKKIDVFPQMFYPWCDEELVKLEKKMEELRNKLSISKECELRLLNRLWGKTDYDKILLGCDGNFYFYEMVLVINNKNRKQFIIGNTDVGINLIKRAKLFKKLFYYAKKEARQRCENCQNKEVCFVPLPLLMWCKSKGENFKEYLEGFCKISKIFVNMSKKIEGFSKNDTDLKKLEITNACSEKEREKTNWSKYLFAKQKFGITHNEYLEHFENLIKNSKKFDLDCSHKIDSDYVHSCRFNLWYFGTSRQKKDSLNKIFSFFKKMSSQNKVYMNYTLLKKLLKENMEMDKIKRVVVGIDYRKNIPDSRVKLWLEVENYPEMINQTLEIVSNKEEVKSFLVEKEFLFGIDFYFSGKTRIKLYPTFTENSLKNKQVLDMLKNKLGLKILELIKKCSKFYISFDEKNEKILHFQPINKIDFIKIFNNNQVSSINGAYLDQGYNLKIISFLEKDIVRNDLSKINLYY